MSQRDFNGTLHYMAPEILYHFELLILYKMKIIEEMFLKKTLSYKIAYSDF